MWGYVILIAAIIVVSVVAQDVLVYRELQRKLRREREVDPLGEDSGLPGRRYEDQHINCQEKPCGQAPLGCTDKRYCPKE